MFGEVRWVGFVLCDGRVFFMGACGFYDVEFAVKFGSAFVGWLFFFCDLGIDLYRSREGF